MCGIVGWIGTGFDAEKALCMRDSLRHRGPDDAGEWRDEAAQVWLGHRRLSIIDLTPMGHQPMFSHSGRHVLVYNGELYNFGELREELTSLGIAIRGGSDSEVLVEAIEHWGLREALKRFNGMFAFALWDRERRSLTLARDRLGEKPLYYSSHGSKFAFASELRALRDLSWVDSAIDSKSVAAYLRHLCVPDPLSILKGVRKLGAGQTLTWQDGQLRIESYWSIAGAASLGRANPFRGSREEAADELDALLRSAVSMRMRSDVPYGAFLSGGIDSSLIAAIMQDISGTPIKTFTIGFKDSANDETEHARAVAKHLGTDHHEKVTTPETILSSIASIVSHHDEPFADGSSVPTYLLCAFAREQVTVAIGGDGGDETHGGYPRYFWAKRIEALRSHLGPTAGMVAAVLRGIPSSVFDGPINRLTKARYAGAQGLAARVHRFADYIAADRHAFDGTLNAAWSDPCAAMLDPPAVMAQRDAAWDGFDWASEMMAVDQAEYLANDILVKGDRMSMSVGLETRLPLLDHRLVEWSWTVPRSYMFSDQGDRGKLLMRLVLDRYVPRHLIERPKVGFGMPMEAWLRGPLRDWADDLLSHHALEQVGILRPDVVRGVWSEHLAGQNRLSQVWTVLMLQTWARTWGPAAIGTSQ